MPADEEISGLTELTEAPHPDDWFTIVDRSDTSVAPTGRTKKIKASNAAGISESHITVRTNPVGDYPADYPQLPMKTGSFGNFVQFGAETYYEGTYDTFVPDTAERIQEIVGDDFTHNPDYDDEHYGSFFLPPDVGGLITISASWSLYDLATGFTLVNAKMSAGSEVYSMPSFGGHHGNTAAFFATASVGTSPEGFYSKTAWMMPDEPGDSLYFGFYITNLSTTQDIVVAYNWSVTLLQRKEA